MIGTILELHITAFFLGYILDLLFGDPHWMIHPVRIIGQLISLLEKAFLKKERGKKDFGFGVLTVIIVLLSTFLVSAFILILGYKINIYLGFAIESFMTYQILATKSLRVESMKVYKALRKSGLESGRKAVSMIVGRDTENLSEDQVIKAAVETVAENTSDGVIAPMLFLIGGPVSGLMYKAVNTMDSMIGYKNDKYLYFGKAAAKLDDFVNFIPARISAILMIVSAFLIGGKFSGKRAFKIFKRDRFNHSSPNSAQTEAACAGALGVKLAGDAYYFGKLVQKPYIGDETREIDIEDIKDANRLMYLTSVICELLCVSLMLLVYFLLFNFHVI